MARSTHIYLIVENGTLIAAFTAKHEAVCWLHKYPENTYRLYRMLDGAASLPQDITP